MITLEDIERWLATQRSLAHQDNAMDILLYLANGDLTIEEYRKEILDLKKTIN